MRMNEKEIDNKVLNNILNAIFNGTDDEEKGDPEKKTEDSRPVAFRKKESYAECCDPDELVFVFTPGEAGALSTEQECCPVMDMSGEHRVNLRIDPFNNGGYLFSYDDRQIYIAGGKRYLTGTIFVIALDEKRNTRNVNAVDVCYICHLLEPNVGKRNCDGTSVLMLDRFFDSL